MAEGPQTGWMEGKTHHYPLRVYYADTDAGTIVHHSSYLVFAERGRSEMMRLVGVHLLQLKNEQGLVFAVRSCEIDFRRTARLDDALEVVSSLLHLGGASLHLVQSIRRGDEEVGRVLIRLVCMHVSGTAARIPAEIRQVLQDYVTQETD
jgi:acyl-CoA thioester hydrolase